MTKKRNYAEEYKKYHGTPEQIAKRSQRNSARRVYEKAHGDLPASVDVNHKTPIGRGGDNAKSNLEATSQAKNRSWRKGKSGYKP